MKCLPGESATRQIFRKDAVSFRRRKQTLQDFEAFAQIPARKLPRAGFDIDIAADPVQEKCHAVAKRFARIIAKWLAVFPRCHGTAQQRLLEMPASLIDLAVYFPAQFFTQ